MPLPEAGMHEREILSCSNPPPKFNPSPERQWWMTSCKLPPTKLTVSSPAGTMGNTYDVYTAMFRFGGSS